MKILVLTISDRASRKEYKDLSGPAVEKALKGALPEARVTRALAPDDERALFSVFDAHGDKDIIITTGGTGIGPRDITPEVTARFCSRLIPGIAEYLRAESLKQTPYAALSRGVAGMKGNTIIINLPGSEKAAEFCAHLIAPLLEHAKKMIEGKGH